MLTYEDLIADMQSGCKPREKWRIGIEHEQLMFDRATGQPLPYDRVKAVLEYLQSRHNWLPVYAHGHLIALEKNGASVTLEPGGQIELSGSAHRTLEGMEAEADSYYAALNDAGNALGIGILAAGIHPEWRREDIPRMPKERYKIMAPYMEKVGKHGVDMMLRTCGVQINLDFDSEADMVKKYRVALGLQPVMTALLANSSRVEGKDSGYKSFRSHIWTETDPARTGVPRFVFEDGMGFARYVDWVLDVPMYFIIRDGRYIDVAGQSFRAFMEGKLKGHEGVLPTIHDWHDHLTTLFPEVRLKTYLELRGMDSVDKPLVYAMAAFWTGILYHEASLDQAWDLIRDWSADAHIRLRDEVPKEGLDAFVPGGGHLRNLAMKAIEISIINSEKMKLLIMEIK